MSSCCSTNNSCTSNEQKPALHIAIIGSGSAAFSCALKALDENGKDNTRITIIEASDNIGGCCVNVGCVPSKILIRAAQLAQQQRNNPFVGLKNHSPELNRKLLSAQQSSRVDELRQAKYQKMLDNNPQITLVKGFAHFSDESSSSSTGKNSVTVTLSHGGEENICADKFLIATGSTPTIPNIKGLSDTPYWTSTEALFATKTPEHLVVIGSSVIALEIAQAYRRLGAEVTVIARHTLLYKEDSLLGEELTLAFEKEGITVLNNTQAQEINHDSKAFTIKLEDTSITCDQLLISTGRHANTDKLNLENVDVSTDRNGCIIVNDKMETSVEGIYAAGDCSNMPQFVYVAAAASSRAAINMTGGEANLDLTTMPAVIFTDPQVATVGLTEQQAEQQNISTISRVLTMDNVPRALANFETDGFIKMIAEKSSGKLIGCQILAHEGGELIQSAAIAMHNNMTVEDLANQLFPYLTMVEGLKLCAQTFNKDVSELSCCAG